MKGRKRLLRDKEFSRRPRVSGISFDSDDTGLLRSICDFKHLDDDLPVEDAFQGAEDMGGAAYDSNW